MSTRTKHRLATLAAMVLASLLMITGLAAAQPGYGQGGPTASLSATLVVSGDSLTVDGAEFVPGEQVTGTVFSDPINLGTKKADRKGSVTFTFSTGSLDLGQHRVLLSAPSGSPSVTFIVVKRSSDDGDNGGSGDSDSDHSSGSDSHHHHDSSISLNGGSGSGGSGGSGGGSDSAAGAPGKGGSGGSSDGLAFTGSNLIIPLSVGGVLLLLVGAAAVVGSRRSRLRGKNHV